MRVLLQCGVHITLQQNSHVISLFGNKFDAKHDIIKTERGKDLCTRVYFYTYTLPSISVYLYPHGHIFILVP